MNVQRFIKAGRAVTAAGVAAMLLGSMAGIAFTNKASAVTPFSTRYTIDADDVVGIYSPWHMGSASSVGTDGVTRGFFGHITQDQLTEYIRYFEIRPLGRPVVSSTPWAGEVLDSAWDGAHTVFLIYYGNGRLYLARRDTTTGAFGPRALLDSGSIMGASIAASAGRWWVVWSKEGTPSLAAAQLFQRHTLLSVAPATVRITGVSGGVSDSAPALAYHSGQIALVWSRFTRSMSQSVVRLAASTGGAWNASTLSWGGIKNEAPDLCYDGDTLHAVWVHIGTVAHAEGRPGAMTAHTVPSAHVTGAKVAASNGRVFVGWSVRDSSGNSGRFAQRDNGVWTVAPVLSPYSKYEFAFEAVLANSGRARVVFRDEEQLYFQEQQVL